MTERIEKSLLEIDFASLTRRMFTPSPAAWEDQVLYFLLLDRFSDGNGKGRLPGRRGPPGEARRHAALPPEDPGRVDYDTWFRAGGGWQGGTLGGLKGKLGYLRRLGVTALWVSPVLPAGRFRADLPRLRHPELPRRGPAFRDPRGVPRLRPGRPRAGDLRHPGHHRPPHRQRLLLRRRTVTRSTTRLRGGGTTTRAGTAGRTPSRASTTARAADTPLRPAPRRQRAGGGLAGRRRLAPRVPAAATCSSARGTSRTGTTTRSMPRGTCSA